MHDLLRAASHDRDHALLEDLRRRAQQRLVPPRVRELFEIPPFAPEYLERSLASLAEALEQDG